MSAHRNRNALSSSVGLNSSLVAGGEWFFGEDRAELDDEYVQDVYRGDDSGHSLFCWQIVFASGRSAATQYRKSVAHRLKDGRFQQLASHLVKIFAEQVLLERKPVLPLKINGTHLVQFQLNPVGH